MGEHGRVGVEALAPRQIECLRMVYALKTSKDIARETGLSLGTVNSYIAEAIAVLGARNRRDAAEILARALPQPATPDKIPPEEIRVDLDLPALPLPPGREHQWRWPEWFPMRQKGASGNDHRIFIRILQCVGLAVACAIGFGMLAVGADVASRLAGR